MTHHDDSPGKSLTPFISLISLAVFIVGYIVLVVLSDRSSRSQEILPLVGLLLLGMQQGLSALFAERTGKVATRNHDMLTNGGLRDNIRQALQEEQVLTRTGPVAPTEIAALRALLIEIRNERQPGTPDDGPVASSS